MSFQIHLDYKAFEEVYGYDVANIKNDNAGRNVIGCSGSVY